MGKSGSVRQNALTASQLKAAENHGKRLDVMGPSRRVRDESPLVYGSLDIVEAQARHMDGVKQQTGAKTKALHMLVQFPTDMSGAQNEETQKAMLGHAVRFANQYHGGNAVFGARLDRDEEGRHTVDVFVMPKHTHTYKDGRTQERATVSKFAKEHALANKETLIDADEKLDPTGSIVQGRAMQAAWFQYLRDECKLKWVMPPERKKYRSKDRLEPEEYKLKQEQSKHIVSKSEHESEKAKWEANKAAERLRIVKARQILEKDQREFEEKQRQLARDAAVLESVKRSMNELPEPALSVIAERNKPGRSRPDRSR